MGSRTDAQDLSAVFLFTVQGDGGHIVAVTCDQRIGNGILDVRLDIAAHIACTVLAREGFACDQADRILGINERIRIKEYMPNALTRYCDTHG